MLKVVQINLHHSKAASATFCQFFAANQFDLALIQEPWLHRGRISGLGDVKGELMYCSSSNNARTCILARKGLHCLPLIQFCSRDCTAVLITWERDGGRWNTIAGSVYLPYDSRDPPPSRDLELLVEHSSIGAHQLLLGVDANAHNKTGWGSTDTNPRGESLLQYIVSNNLHVCNIGNSPTFVTRNRSEVIDITLCSNNVLGIIRGWHVSNEPSASDHRYISFYLDGNTETLSYRSPRATDWTSYKDALSAALDSVPRRVSSFPDIDHIANETQNAILSCYHDSCPLRQRKRQSNTRWWTPKLGRLKTNVRRVFNYCKASGNWEPHRRALTAYSLAIKKAKLKSWKQFTQEVNSISDAARLQRVLASTPINPIGSLKLPGGGFTCNTKESLKLLLETHFPSCKLSDDVECDSSCTGSGPWPRTTRENWNVAGRIVTLSGVKWALSKFSPFKSPGGDGIFPALLQRAPDSLHAIVCELLRASLAYGYIPQAWRLSKVTFIPKRGRTDHSQAKSFRPISLSSFLLKTLERLVGSYLRKRVLSGTPLHRNQHAYQPGKSCDTALHQLVGRIEESLANKEIALCAFLDIEGAFDNTPFEAMVRGVTERGADPLIGRWISSMLHSRRTRASLRGESMEAVPTKGCPQGGVLSPLLWNLVVDGLLDKLSEADIYAQGYADDIVLMVQGKYCNVVADIMNVGLRCVQTWCQREGLSVNPTKTTIVPFTRKKNLESLSRLRLGPSKLSISSSAKYLGLVLDSKLTWNEHLDSVLRKAKWSLLTTRRFASSTWGIKPHIALWLYCQVVRPQITYGALAWWPKVQQVTVRDKLASLQRLACLITTGAFTSTPTVAMEVILGLLPLDIFIQAEARKASFRLRTANHWRAGLLTSGHSSISRVVDTGSVLDMTSDVMQGQTVLARSFTTSLGLRRDWRERPESKSCRGCRIWYTDGSLLNGKSGYGIYSTAPRTAISASLGAYSTVFQAEVSAILACANLAMARQLQGERIAILSDSQAAIQALDSNLISSRLVWECFNALNTLSSQNNVHLGWVPGHTGITGNECADELARNGALLPFVGPEPACGISKSTAYNAVSAWAKNKHLLRWQTYTGQTLGRKLVRGPTVQLTKCLTKLTRGKLKQAVALITGHGRFRKHLHKLGIINTDPRCRLCSQSDETASHILLECERLEVKRRRLFGPLQPGDDHDANIGQKILSLVEGTGLGLSD